MNVESRNAGKRVIAMFTAGGTRPATAGVMRHVQILFLLLLTSCALHDRDTGEPAPSADGLRVFVSRGRYDGALRVDDLSGVAAADTICELRAKAAGLGGTWVAWLSSTSATAIERVEALGPWQLVGGERAFENRAQLYGEPLVRLDRDERGEVIEPYGGYSVPIWTGTRAGGLSHADTCGNWTATAGDGHYGRASESFAWTDYSSTVCSTEHHLLCLEL